MKKTTTTKPLTAAKANKVETKLNFQLRMRIGEIVSEILFERGGEGDTLDVEDANIFVPSVDREADKPINGKMNIAYVKSIYTASNDSYAFFNTHNILTDIKTTDGADLANPYLIQLLLYLEQTYGKGETKKSKTK